MHQNKKYNIIVTKVFDQLDMLTYLVKGGSPVNPKALLELLDTYQYLLALRTRISACHFLSIGLQTGNNQK
jgi:hypothetical protein